MRIWRIGKAKYLGDRLGTGAKLAGGRWNSKGVPVLYFSATRSLAALELFVHLESQDLPDSLSVLGVDVPEAIFTSRARTDFGDLAPYWRHYPAPVHLQGLGDDWVRIAKSVILEVPSAVIPQESNYLLNPNHSEFGKLAWSKPERFVFDPRMWKAP